MEINKIYNEDCLSGMKNIPDKSIDMILADLPYGSTRNKWDSVLPLDLLWLEYERVIKDNGAIVLFAQGLFYVDLVNSNRKLFRYDLTWNKILTTGFLNAKRMPLRQHEQIAVFYKKLPTYNPIFTEGKPLHSIGNNKNSSNVKNNNYGKLKSTNDERKGSTEKYPTSIINIQKPHPSISVHPTQKPIELFEYLIKTYTNENEVVLDNTIGSGTTAIAAINTNRKFIGFETDIQYYNITIDRIEKTYSIIK